MRILIPLLICLCLLGACNGTATLAPGAEQFQSYTGPDGAVTESSQGVRLRVGTIKTQAAPQAAAEKADAAASKFQKGGEANRAAAKDANKAAANIVWAALLLGGLIFLSVLTLGLVLLLRKRN